MNHFVQSFDLFLFEFLHLIIGLPFNNKTFIGFSLKFAWPSQSHLDRFYLQCSFFDPSLTVNLSSIKVYVFEILVKPLPIHVLQLLIKIVQLEKLVVERQIAATP